MKHKPKANAPLSPREREVAARLALGESNKLIAAALNISEHTAKFHVVNVIAKLGAQTRVDAAVKYALSAASRQEAFA